MARSEIGQPASPECTSLRQAPLIDEHATELGQVWLKGVASEVAIKILKERPT